ncbi:MAG: flavodoxin family protein [bacterium]|nr:flavodoxin family protein [bacterium]
MRVVGFVGSPRKGGNSETLVKEVLAGAAENGGETEIYYLNDLSIKGCQACGACKTSDVCATDDDMLPLLDEIKGAAAIIVGSPVYMYQMTGQTKLFFDRFFALLDRSSNPRFEKGKPVVLVFAQGETDEDAYTAYFDHTARFLTVVGFNVKNVIIAAGVVGTGEAKEIEGVMIAARDAGRELIEAIN